LKSFFRKPKASQIFTGRLFQLETKVMKFLQQPVDSSFLKWSFVALALRFPSQVIER
tara:strand:- start:293 stop:463 length:171 start_codon:yes stop_codon:yes gene_type:complete